MHKIGFVWIKVILPETLPRLLCALKEKQSPATKRDKEERAREAQRNALVQTLKAPFDFPRLEVCTALPEMK